MKEGIPSVTEVSTARGRGNANTKRKKKITSSVLRGGRGKKSFPSYFTREKRSTTSQINSAE